MGSILFTAFVMSNVLDLNELKIKPTKYGYIALLLIYLQRCDELVPSDIIEYQ